MISYAYSCPDCGEFEVEQSIKDASLENCPQCGSPVERLISGGLHVAVRKEPTTIGQLAERNTKKKGRYEMQETLPPPPKTNEKYKKISKMSPEQKRRYILEGRL